MSSGKIPLGSLEEESSIPDRWECSEGGCRIQLDRMPERVVFHPDEDNSGEMRADCAIFYPEESDSNPLFRGESEIDDPNADFLSIVELKNTAQKPSRIQAQIEGAIDFAIDLLDRCKDPPWNLTCFCLVCKRSSNTYSKPINQIRIRRHINGENYWFRPIPVDSGDSLRGLMEQERIQDTMREL